MTDSFSSERYIEIARLGMIQLLKYLVINKQYKIGISLMRIKTVGTINDEGWMRKQAVGEEIDLMKCMMKK